MPKLLRCKLAAIPEISRVSVFAFLFPLHMLPQQHDSLGLDFLLDLLETHLPKPIEVNVPHFLDLVLLAGFSGGMILVELLILKSLALLFILLGFGFGDLVFQRCEVLFAE